MMPSLPGLYHLHIYMYLFQYPSPCCLGKSSFEFTGMGKVPASVGMREWYHLLALHNSPTDTTERTAAYCSLIHPADLQSLHPPKTIR